jgi:hypothetical protein
VTTVPRAEAEAITPVPGPSFALAAPRTGIRGGRNVGDLTSPSMYARLEREVVAHRGVVTVYDVALEGGEGA